MVLHWSGFSCRLVSFTPHMRRLRLGHHLNIGTLFAILLQAAIESASLPLFGGEDLFHIRNAKLPSRLHGTIILLRDRIPEACVPVAFDPLLQLRRQVLCSTPAFPANEKHQVDGLSQGLAVQLLVPVREAAPLSF